MADEMRESSVNMNAQIATAAEEQSNTADEINRNVDNIRGLAEHAASGAGQVTSASDELARLAAELPAKADRFRTQRER